MQYDDQWLGRFSEKVYPIKRNKCIVSQIIIRRNSIKCKDNVKAKSTLKIEWLIKRKMLRTIKMQMLAINYQIIKLNTKKTQYRLT
jgi:hypothetical protein